jgi:hypothetical protein
MLLVMDYDLGKVRLVFSHDRVACSWLESHGCSLLPFGLGRDHLLHDEDFDLQRSGVATVSECQEPLR